MDILSPIQYLKGVGPQRTALLAKLGIRTLKDMLFYLPSRYEDRSSIKEISQLSMGEISTVTGKVIKVEIIPAGARGHRLKILAVVITDGSGALTAKWFNQTYLGKTFKPGQKFVFYGMVKSNYRGSGCEMVNPEFELIDDCDEDTDNLNAGRIVPVYRLTDGVSQRQFRNILHSTLASALCFIPDPVPENIINNLHLPDLRQSIEAVHFPPSETALNDLNSGTSPYHQRLAFDELFTLQLGLAAIRNNEIAERGISIVPNGELTSKLLGKLPFRLTGAQQRVIDDIVKDMKAPSSMNRLVQGDVGSGKTIVAFIAMLGAVEGGYQAALMAPTEILAEQHYLNIHHLAESLGLKIHLLTGSKKDKDQEMIASGGVQIVIGTHALIQEAVSFQRLGLIVIDEQHRFGVLQRAKLRGKGANPNALIMTATPIPRTLAITLYGDLDYSLIDELPPNRTPVVTRVISETHKNMIYDMIDHETKMGRQAYVVYPLIEESDKSNLRAAVTGMNAIQKKFPHVKVGLIHGKLPTPEREDIMRDFKEGVIQILVSTTVIEVGVDVPNAALMVIIHAERFGLSQLHQLRGRVGRGVAKSHCILLNYGGSVDAMKRLNVMAGTNDGFKIAEKDLEIRGPGEFFGTRQSGIPDLRAANLLRDFKLLEIARKQAFALIADDPSLISYPQLKSSLEDFWGQKLELFKTA